MAKRAAKMTLGPDMTIPSPRPSRFLRGRNATEAAATIRAIRVSDEMYSAIGEACEILGMSRNEFFNWCAYMCANETIRQWRELEKNKPPPPIESKPSPLTLTKPTRITRL